MARRSGATFTGAPPPDASRGSSIFARWLRSVADDVGLTYDKLTGLNGAVDPINHSGGTLGRGAPIGLPLACQEIQRPIGLVGTGKLKSNTYILAVPVFVPDDGIQSYRLELKINFRPDIPVFAEVRDSTWTTFFGPTPAPAVDPYGSWSLPLGPGVQYVLVSTESEFDEADTRFISSWRLYPKTGRGDGAGAVAISGGSVGNALPVSSLNAGSWIDIFDEQVEDYAPLDAFVLTRLNRSINGLLEYVMGGPVPGNESYSTSPSRRNNGTFPDAVIECPLVCMAFGACETGTGSPVVDAATTSGMTQWFAPQAAAGTTPTGVFVGGEAPTFNPHGYSTSKKARVLAASAVGSPLSFTASVNGSAFASFVRLGSSNFYEATCTSVPYVGGALNSNQVRISKGSAVAFGELSVLGVCVYTE